MKKLIVIFVISLMIFSPFVILDFSIPKQEAKNNSNRKIIKIDNQKVSLDQKEINDKPTEIETLAVRGSGISLDTDHNENGDSVSFTSVPNDTTYIVNSTGNTLSWQGEDSDEALLSCGIESCPDTYELTVNGTSEKSGAWNESSEILTFNIDGQKVGNYEYNLTIFDNRGDSESDTAIVTVYDPVPTMNSPEDITIEYQTTGNLLTWNASDNNPENYTIYQNQIVNRTGTWNNDSDFTVDLDPLELGIYNLTLIIQDHSNQSVMDTVIVEVVDKIEPKFDFSMSDKTYEYRTTGNNLTWIVTDESPHMYIIYKDNNVIDQANYTSGEEIVIDIDGLDLGTYNYSIFVNDTTSNYNTDTVLVTVEDTTPPELDSPSDYNYEYTFTGNHINWNATDLLEENYTVLLDGNFFKDGEWSNATLIEINVDGLEVGTHNFTIIVRDTSGNIARDTVFITVEDTLVPDLTGPNDFTYEYGSTSNKVDWNASDPSAGEFFLYVNGELNDSGSWNNDSDLIFSVDGLDVGTHNLTIAVMDLYNNTAVHSVEITVVDTTSPEITSHLGINHTISEQSTDNRLNWTVTDLRIDRYEILLDGSFQTGNTVDSGDLIEIGVDYLDKGIYNFTIVVYDLSSNTATSTLILEVIDTTIPSIHSSSGNYTYAKDTTGNEIYWIANDTYPDTFIIFQNGTEQINATWNNGETIELNIDGLDVGTYNYSILINDTSGNLITDTVYVFVIPRPVFNDAPGNNSFYRYDTTGNDLEWNISDSDPDEFFLYLNGSGVYNGTWNNLDVKSYNIDYLELGTYNFTMVLTDLAGNSAILETIIHIVDLTSPELVANYNNSTLTIEEGEEIELNWQAFDPNNGSYQLLINTNLEISGGWDNSTVITLDISSRSDFPVGEYNITIIFSDTYGNSITYNLTLSVLDTTAPQVDTYDNIDINLKDNDLILEWNATDTYPDNYTIFVNNTSVQQANWYNDEPITFDISGFSAGSYEICIEIVDMYENSVLNCFTVSILILESSVSLEEPTTSVYTGDMEIIHGTWTSSGDEIANGTINVTIQSLQINNLTQYYTNSSGQFRLVLDYTGFVQGTYQITIDLNKYGYYNKSLQFEISVQSRDLLIELEIPNQLVEGEEFSIIAHVMYGELDSTSFGLNELVHAQGPVSGVLVLFEIVVLYQDGGTETYRRNATTNSEGQARVVLSGGETNSIEQLQSVSSTIASSGIHNGAIQTVNTSETVDVVRQGNFLIKLFNLIANYIDIILLYGIPTLVLLIVAIFIFHRRRQSILQRQEILDRAYNEIKALKTMQLVMLQDENGINYFTMQLQRIGVDSSLLGGLASAISSFLTEVSQSDTLGYEFMEREGTVISSHKTKLSTFIITSDNNLPDFLLDNIEKAHKKIDRVFRQRIVAGTGESIDTEVMLELLNEEGLRLPILGELVFIDESMEKLTNNDTLTKRQKHDISILYDLFIDNQPLEGMKIGSLIDFYTSRGYEEKEAIRLLLLAYKSNILIPLAPVETVGTDIDLLEGTVDHQDENYVDYGISDIMAEVEDMDEFDEE